PSGATCRFGDPRMPQSRSSKSLLHDSKILPIADRLGADARFNGRGVTIAFLDAGFYAHADVAKPRNREDVPTYVLVPSFILSELKTSFQMGFMLYLPFLILDMVVSSILMAMGMMMLPPVVISLPFKLLLFVLVDGWQLVVGSLIKSFG
ncbi:MAG: hypothetical protein HY075_14435, partial [Deltaproteobacteria bacterium]|nr:hypothetical protein [Deltaproteobacteria bacterium]